MYKTISSGDTIGVISPAWIPVQDRLEKGIKYLQERGYRVKTGKNINKKNGYFAGKDQERVHDLEEMYRDKEVKCILCSRGGWGGLRMVDKLDYKLIGDNPKPLVGYSDVTTLQLAIWQQTGQAALSGPMVGVEMGRGIEPFTEEHFWQQIQNKAPDYYVNYGKWSVTTLSPGNASGVLLGGCLAMVAGLLGTPYCPDYRNAVLFIEDIGEQPYKIDRYLAQLHQAGIFDQVSGLILGEFLDCDPGEVENSFTVDEILQDYFSQAAFPVIANFPYGHGMKKFTMPVGMMTSFNTETQELSLANPFHQYH